MTDDFVAKFLTNATPSQLEMVRNNTSFALVSYWQDHREVPDGPIETGKPS